MNIKTAAKNTASATGKATRATGYFLGEVLSSYVEMELDKNPYSRLQRKYGIVTVNHLAELPYSDLLQVLEQENISYRPEDLVDPFGAILSVFLEENGTELYKRLSKVHTEGIPLSALRGYSYRQIRDLLANAGVVL